MEAVIFLRDHKVTRAHGSCPGVMVHFESVVHYLDIACSQGIGGESTFQDLIPLEQRPT